MAQALIHEPEVLILDEPTSGLDPNQIRGVRETITRLGQKKTILLSTHILQEVEAMADRVVMINEGRKVYDGLLKDMDPEGLGLDHVFANLTGHCPHTGVKLKESELDPELAATANRALQNTVGDQNESETEQTDQDDDPPASS